MRESLLLIEEDAEESKILEETLFQIGLRFKMFTARNAHETFDLLDELKGNLPRLIIMNSDIPKTIGMEILDKLTENYGIPVILHCTHCTPEVNRQAKSSGAIDCLKKGTSYADNLKFAKRVAEIVRDISL